MFLIFIIYMVFILILLKKKSFIFCVPNPLSFPFP